MVVKVLVKTSRFTEARRTAPRRFRVSVKARAVAVATGMVCGG